jgi:N-carbamoylputrescine amidase
MLQHVRVAAAPLEGRPDEIDDNIERIGMWAHRAAQTGASLLLTPELSLTGFIPNHPDGHHAVWLREALLGARRLAQPLDGPAVRHLCTIARDTGLLIAAGLLEDAGAQLHNTHVLVGPHGLLGAWRKMHVPLFEHPFYAGGGVPPVVSTPIGRIGITICIDAFLPESVRLLAVQGAEIVLFPFAADPPPVNPSGWAKWAGPTLQARCRENGVFGLACNVAGEVAFAGLTQKFGGGAMAVAPTGEVIARHGADAPGPHLLVIDLERAAQVAARAAFEYTWRMRRPELYGLLAEHHVTPPEV